LGKGYEWRDHPEPAQSAIVDRQYIARSPIQNRQESQIHDHQSQISKSVCPNLVRGDELRSDRSPRGTSMGQVWMVVTIGGLAAALLLTRAISRRRARAQIDVGGVSEGWLAEHRGSRTTE